VIDVPSTLSAEQDEAVERLAKTMNGNPRASLFTGSGQAQSSAGADR
jgi:hypothetical protein